MWKTAKGLVSVTTVSFFDCN